VAHFFYLCPAICGTLSKAGGGFAHAVHRKLTVPDSDQSQSKGFDPAVVGPI
jgi:hypothetical protein